MSRTATERARRQRCRGFSLAEMMLATLVFTVGYLALIGIFPSCARSVRQARIVMLANHVAQRQLENAVSAAGGFDAIANDQGQMTIVSVVNNSTETLTISWQITVTNPGGDATLKDVRCVASWVPLGVSTGPLNDIQPVTVQMETMVASLS